MTDTPAQTGPIDQLLARFADVRVRGLLFAGLGGLAVLFAGLFLRGSDAGGVLILCLALPGLAFGWRASPVFVLLVLFWFLVFPDGLPPAYEDDYELAEGHFRPADLLLAVALLVYLSAHYRLYGVTTAALPAEGKSKPRKRPAELIRTGELPRLLYAVAAFVVFGQILWAVVATVEIDVLSPWPFYFPTRSRYAPRGGDLAPWRARLVALVGLLFFGAVLARLVFSYWRLRLLTPAEGAMILTTGGWEETHRERVRIEVWRMWAVRRVADRVRAMWKRPKKGGGK